MKLLYVSQFYEPEHIAPAFRATDNARCWSGSGVDVTVLTGYPNYPLGHVFEGYDEHVALTEDADGSVRVLRSRLIVKPNTNIVNRAENALSFKHYACQNFRRNRARIGTDYNLVLATSGTVFAAQAGAYIARKLGVPLIFELRDITFVQLMATGVGPRSPKVALMRRWELKLCRQAAKVVVLTKGFKRVLCENGVSEEKIVVIPNGTNLMPVGDVRVDSKGIRQDRPLTVGYFGTIGLSQGLETDLDYLSELNKKIPVRFSIIGAGAQHGPIDELVSQRYPFAAVGDQVKPEELDPIVSQCDICVVSLRRSDSFSTTLPSKLFHIMGKCKPVLFVGPRGEASRLLEDAGAGIVLDGSREDDLAKLIGFFSQPDWRSELRRMGDNGRRLVEASFDRRKLAAEYLSLIESVCEGESHRD